MIDELVKIPNGTGISFSEGWSPVTRPLLILLTAVICLTGLLGNSLVLHGSLQHNSLRLEQISRALIQNIALCDALASLLLYLPMLITLIADDWVLGGPACFVVAHSNYLLVLNEIWLVLFMSGYRLWVIKKPKGHRLSIKCMWAVGGVQWSLSIALLVYSVSMKIPAKYKSLSCDTDLYYNKKTYGDYLTIAILIIPLFGIFLLNAILLFSVYATNKKSNKSISHVRKPTIMLTLVTLIELVSLIPVVYMVMIHHADPKNQWIRENISWFRIFAVYMLSLNVCSNPLIYLATNKSFNIFVRRVVRCQRVQGREITVVSNFKTASARSRVVPLEVE